MVSFFQLAAEKKTQFLVQLKQIFGPSYFFRALVLSLQRFLLHEILSLLSKTCVEKLLPICGIKIPTLHRSYACVDILQNVIFGNSQKIVNCRYVIDGISQNPDLILR